MLYAFFWLPLDYQVLICYTPIMIQVFKPLMGQEKIDAVAEVLRSGWIGLGRKTAEFEKKFAGYMRAAHAGQVIEEIKNFYRR